jgi:aldehyde dehydrogenase (NAD+)
MDMLTTSEEDLALSLQRKRAFFDAGQTRSESFRLDQLRTLRKAIETYENEALDALRADYGKPRLEAFTSEIGILFQEIDHAIAHLQEWMRPDRVHTPLPLQPGHSEILTEPLGVVLIIGPWNYPFQLVLGPLIGAIAAGNCVILKPSEETPHASRVISEMVSATFDDRYISVVQGPGQVVGPQLIENHRFDHIFFTGSPRVGRLIAGMAARHLTPVTLELGGKSPVILDKSAKLDIAAKRIVWGKFFNAGQTCVAPDYILAHDDIKDAFVDEVKTAIQQFYGSDPKASPDFARIVNNRRFHALEALMTGDIVVGGATDAKDRYIAPTVIDNVTMDHPAMREEIFGPIMPILTWRDRDEVVSCVRQNRYPLASYVFAEDPEVIAFFVDAIEYGGGGINNCILHLANPDLPFGGVGYSGIGRYHGHDSYLSMSNRKSVLTSATWIDPALRYPPYSDRKEAWVEWFMH